MLDHKVETFLKAAELKSYTAAAEALHMTQPAVTQHIHKLEAYYQCQLVDSTGRVTRLTEAGARLYQYLSVQRANERQFTHSLCAVAPPLHVGSTLSIADYYLPEVLLPHLLEEGLRLRVQVVNGERLIELLLRGGLDCAFIEGPFDAELFESQVFYQARFLPVVAAGHPLVGKVVPLRMLYDYPLALREEGSGTRELLESYLYQHNETPRSFKRVVELGSFVLLKEFLKRSDAISFMYEGVARREVEQGELCFLQVQGYHFVHPLHFIFRKGTARRIEMINLLKSLLD